MSQITLRIDGRPVEAEEGMTLLQAAKSAGIYIPALCADDDLEPYGGCRLCLVEIEGWAGLPAACTTQARERMVVRTTSSLIDSVRRTLVELLMANGHGDCLTCTANQRCDLQKVAAYVIPQEGRFLGVERAYPLDESNPFFTLDMNKCILCAKCVRTCDEIQFLQALDLAYRGYETKVSPDFDQPWLESICESCGQCEAKCPVGAIYEQARLEATPSAETRTVCVYCGVGCGLYLLTRGERVVGVRGDPTNPASKGRLCVKGRFGYGFINHPDRLSRPLIKRDDRFEEASWDEALNLVAQRLLEIKERYGPEAIAILGSAKCTNEENYLIQKFARLVIGNNNIDHCARLCHASSVTGLAAAFGSGAMTNSIADLAEAKAFLVIGSNTTEQHPIIGLELRGAVRRGARLILADPRKIDLMRYATLHLQHRPGSDVALLNGLAHIILKEGLEDKEFIAQRTENFEAWREVVGAYTPERVSEITGVKVEDLYAAARIYATSKPAALLYAMGITQHTSGHQNVLACANLSMLTGNIGLPGGGVNPLRGHSNVQGACDVGALYNFFPGYQPVSDEVVRKKFEKAWGQSLPSKPGLTLVEIFNAAHEGKVRGMYIMGENAVLSDPHSRHVQEALGALDFLVVQEIFLSETAQLADVVLPAASFAEKEGTITNTERRVQRLRQAIPPVGESRPDWEIICDLARRMDGTDPAQWTYSHPSEIMEEIARLAPIYGGISYERLEDGGLQWPCPDSDHPGTPILHVGRFTRGLGHFTPVEQMPPDEETDEEYPLILTTGRVLEHWHTGTMTRRVPGLERLVPEERIRMNPLDAAQRGVEDGDWARIASRRGEVRARVEVTEECAPGVVFMTFHFAEAAANFLTNPALDPVAKIPEFKVCAVQVERLKG